ncbi:MAG: hypothetical protein FDX30_12065 [Chlorobium sp.]|jgi:Zn-finger nucleic acid-binding protein|nr:MAG: hypothetical protein FDX30_12065 [Chlorobium sp.]
MKCPVCNVDLLITERQSIEIDYCPQCRGVWLDRGELDKIIERSMNVPNTVEYPADHRYESSHQDRHYDHHNDDHDYYYDPKTGKRKRRGGPLGFLGELFD